MSPAQDYSAFLTQPAVPLGLASPGETHQLMLPVTPQMDVDPLLTVSAAGSYSVGTGAVADMHPIGMSSAEAPALHGALFGLQFPYEGLSAMAHCSATPATAAPAAVGLLYPPSFTKPAECLPGMPLHPLAACSPEFLPVALGDSSSSGFAAAAAAVAMGLSCPQALQMYTPLPQGTPFVAAASIPVVATAAPIEGEPSVYPGPIMEPTRLHAEGPFRNADAALIPNLAALASPGMQIYANQQAPFGLGGIPSLLQTPQLGHVADASGAFSVGTPAMAPVPAHLLRLRMQSSPSLSEPARARSSSPSLSRLAGMPYAASRAPLQRRNTGPASRTSESRRIRSHSRAGSDVLAGCAPAPAARPSASDDASSACGGDDDGRRAPSRTLSGRQYLDAEQRRVFFRWLYQNVNDPKPKGAERDRLRSIGNMSRERFKTWFANARRRYFNVTFDGDVQRYTINDRFREVCERDNIVLD
ncbi:hypothetical protein IWQ56_001708 [Coemansia nantahalensis]|nr:hypothetical protein IWQ56_001708 [Coemansia nantahalensis]